VLVYRASRASFEPPAALDALAAALGRLAGSPRLTTHDGWVDLLIDAGQLEAGAADAVCPEADDDHLVLTALRDVSVGCARGERAAWHGAGAGVLRATAARLARAIAALRALPLPSSASAGVPEGYAYYALYPESYGEAARRFFHAARPHEITCVGVRTIGTSLAAVVAAELQSLGCDVRGWTVRPRGHPFDRRVRLTPALAHAMSERRQGYALVVDEGPGLSGSSFAATAEALVALGFPAERVVLFPSWEPDGSALVSQRARVRWGRHAKYVVGFEELWWATGRLARLAGAHPLDCSAGKWRDHLIPDPRHHPAVQPQHEQRKYLTAAAPSPEPAPVLLKFVGLGRYGRARLERCERLADAGFAPRPLGLAEGFLRSEFVAGSPLREGRAGRALIARVADYLAFVRRSFATGRSASFDAIAEMIDANVAEGLGDDWRARSSALGRWRGTVEGTEAVAIDGRMLAHEWIRSGRRYLKTDGLSHHDDHFWPGCQDVAWDIAAAIIELRLGPAEVRALLERYRAQSGDAGVAARLPFARVAYLASRLGYVTLAASALGGSADGRRMTAAARRYAAGLRRCLTGMGDRPVAARL